MENQTNIDSVEKQYTKEFINFNKNFTNIVDMLYNNNLFLSECYIIHDIFNVADRVCIKSTYNELFDYKFLFFTDYCNIKEETYTRLFDFN